LKPQEVHDVLSRLQAQISRQLPREATKTTARKPEKTEA
jgi:hypothetical protein